MKLEEITNFLESIAPLELQENYDNAGLLIGDSNMVVTGALCTLDSTEEVIDEAIELGFNLVVAHHPIIFSGVKKFSNYYVHRVIKKAIKNDIAIYAIHTNLDNVLIDGVNENIAQILGLTKLSILRPKLIHNLPSPKHDNKPLGSGIVGTLNQPMNENDALNMIKEKMECKIIRHTKLLGESVNIIACCGGSGSFLLKDAIACKADIFITADFKYHEFFDADNKIVIADIGHYETEHFTKNLLFKLINNKFPNFAAQYSNLNTNPVLYHQ